jgi:hypothetical protein
LSSQRDSLARVSTAVCRIATPEQSVLPAFNPRVKPSVSETYRACCVFGVFACRKKSDAPRASRSCGASSGVGSRTLSPIPLAFRAIPLFAGRARLACLATFAASRLAHSSPLLAADSLRVLILNCVAIPLSNIDKKTFAFLRSSSRSIAPAFAFVVQCSPNTGKSSAHTSNPIGGHPHA